MVFAGCDVLFPGRSDHWTPAVSIENAALVATSADMGIKEQALSSAGGARLRFTAATDCASLFKSGSVLESIPR